MYCKNCGYENVDENNYCIDCGENITDGFLLQCDFESIGICRDCEEIVRGNYCEECGSIAINPRIIEVDEVEKKNKATKSDKSRISDLVNGFKEYFTQKDKFRAHFESSILTLLISLVVSFILLNVIKNIDGLNERYNLEIKGLDNILINVVDLTNLMWLNKIKISVILVEWQQSFNYSLLLDINIIFLLIIPLVGIHMSNTQLKKKKEVGMLDYVMTSIIFSVLLNSISFILMHRVTESINDAEVKIVYGSAILSNVLGGFLIYFIFSIVLDYKKILEKYNNNVYVDLLIKAIETVKNFLVYSSFLVVALFIAMLLIQKAVFSSNMIILIFLIPNFILYGVNLLTGGIIEINSNGENVMRLSGSNLINFTADLVGDEPIFFVGLFLLVAILVGSIWLIYKGTASFTEKYKIKETLSYAIFVAVIIHGVGFVAKFTILSNISDDSKYLDQMKNVFIEIGFSNYESIFISFMVVAIISIGSNILRNGYHSTKKLEQYLTMTRKRVLIYGSICVMFMLMYIIIFNSYSYNNLSTIIMSKINYFINELNDSINIIEYLS